MSATELRLYNTLTRRKEDFVPIDPDHVRMYVCGPTVYDFAHIGNARPVIVFDVLFRLLRHVYGKEHVIYARNLTDVDDKINARAVRDYPDLPLNEAIRKVTESTAAQFQRDVTALGNLAPTSQPRATEHLEEMRQLIERLIERKHAYVADDHVLFAVKTMTGEHGPRYGALARRSLDEMIAGARVDVASYKRDEMDFVLWKPSKQGEPGWPSPAGIAVNGRPGWHIECSAMSMAKLLEPFGGGLKCDDPLKNTFDIHAGGIDLVFPHHENEIAQSCCAFSSEHMANIWMHNGFLQVEGQKMSKSLGNFITIHELLETQKFGGRQWSGEVLRLAMLMTHYREPLDLSILKLQEAELRLDKWKKFAEVRVDKVFNKEKIKEFVNYLADDLNVHKAMMIIDDLCLDAGVESSGTVYRILKFLGFKIKKNKHGRIINHIYALHDEMEGMSENERLIILNSITNAGYSPELNLLTYVMKLKKSIGRNFKVNNSFFKNNAVASELLQEIAILTKPAKTTIDRNRRIQRLVDQRLVFLKERKWAEADRIRDSLLAQNIQLKDGKDPVTGERVTTWEVKR